MIGRLVLDGKRDAADSAAQGFMLTVCPPFLILLVVYFIQIFSPDTNWITGQFPKIIYQILMFGAILAFHWLPAGLLGRGTVARLGLPNGLLFLFFVLYWLDVRLPLGEEYCANWDIFPPRPCTFFQKFGTLLHRFELNYTSFGLLVASTAARVILSRLKAIASQ